jgi:methionyl-tRNA synthetase
MPARPLKKRPFEATLAMDGNLADFEALRNVMAGGSEITIDDFVKIELKTARVKAAALHPDADKLLVLTVEVGTEERTICAGIRQWWQPEQLVGKDIVIVANLAPRKLRGVMSQGMMLAVHDGENVVPLTAMNAVNSGLRVS